MRDVSSTIRDAIIDSPSVNMRPKITAYKTRVFFEEDDLADMWAFDTTPIPGRDTVIASTKLYECTEAGQTISVIATLDNYNGVMYLNVTWPGFAGRYRVDCDGSPLLTGSICVPNLHGDFIYYYDWTYSTYKIGVLDIQGIVNNHSITNIVSRVIDLDRITEATGAAGGIYPTYSDTTPVDYARFFIAEIVEGAIKVTYGTLSDTTTVYETCGYRIIEPDHFFVYNDHEDYDYFMYAGAAMLTVNDQIYNYFYISRRDGSVSGIYAKETEGANVTWSDWFIAVPEDLSIFKIGNVFMYDEKVFMVGKFYREEEFATEARYTLLLVSEDGETFSFDRKTLVTTYHFEDGTRFQGACNSTDIVFAQWETGHTNWEWTYYKTGAPYSVIGEDAEHAEVVLRSIAGSIQGGWTANLKAGDEAYYDDPLVAEGNYAKLEIEVLTGARPDEYESVKYHDCVISQVNKSWKDGVRAMQINLLPDGIWHVNNMTHPYYMEIQSKEYIGSAMTSLTSLYNVGATAGQAWALSQDLWDPNDLTNHAVHSHNPAAKNDVLWGQDLVTSGLCVDYPVFGTAEHYYFDIYGWSRAGIPSVIPNEEDPTSPADTENDMFFAKVLYEDLDGVEHTITATSDHCVSMLEGYPCQHPPQTWFEEHEADGVYPVQYLINNPGAGCKIKKLGVLILNNNDDDYYGEHYTTYYIERLEMPAISATYAVSSNTSFEVVDPTTEEPIDSTYERDANTISKIIMKQKGVPQLLFATTPYSAWNFDVMGKFLLHGPYSMVGLVGLATDADNYIVGYAYPGMLGLGKMRDGVFTVLYEYAGTSGDEVPIEEDVEFELRFWHRDGTFGVEYKIPSTTEWKQRGSCLLQDWDDAWGTMTNEEPTVATNELGLTTTTTGARVYHVGIWARINPPKFRSAGFRSSSTLIPVMPCDYEPSTTYDFTDFPGTSGTVDCEGSLYTWSGKITTPIPVWGIRGPYELVTVDSWSGGDEDPFPVYPGTDPDGYDFTGELAIEMSGFAWLGSTVNHDLFNGAIVSLNQYNAMAGETFFRPYVEIEGTNHKQLEKWRVYLESEGLPLGDSASYRNKVWITYGLDNVSALSEGDAEKLHAEGSFVYEHNDDKITLLGFMAFDGKHDNTIESLLEKICKISGTLATFPGDLTLTEATITAGSSLVVGSTSPVPEGHEPGWIWK